MTGSGKRKRCGACLLCDRNDLDPAFEYCVTCAKADSKDLFNNIEDSFHIACGAAQINTALSDSLLEVAAKENELDDVVRRSKLLGLGDLLRDNSKEKSVRKLLDKLLSCRLCRMSRMALSMSDAREFVNSTMEYLAVARLRDGTRR
jgi:hypothetical protein